MTEITNDNLDKTSELSLIECLSINVLPHTKHGRLRNKLTELQKAVHAEFNSMAYITLDEKNQACKRVTDFGKKTGWDRTEKHPVTLISFLLEMIENSKCNYNPKITILLNEIFEYYERGKQVKAPCLVAGKIGNEKWIK